MKFKKIKIKELYKLSDLPEMEVQLKLIDLDIDPKNEESLVPSKKIKEVLRAIYARRSSRRVALNISKLAEQLDLREDMFRNLLHAKGMIKKKDTKYLPDHLYKDFCELINKRHPENAAKAGIESNEEFNEPKSDKVKTKREKKKARVARGAIGPIPTRELSYMTVQDVEDIHFQLVKDFKKSKDPMEPPGVKSYDLLESALTRPLTSLGDNVKYPTVSMAAAALLHAIVHNHPFHNGNKRTALVSMVIFLDKNGYVITIDQDSIYDYLLKLASHSLINKKTESNISQSDEELEHIAVWVQGNVKQLNHGENPLKLRRLKSILDTHGCIFEKAKNNKIKVIRGDLYAVISAKESGREVRPEIIHDLRKDLELDAEHGYDSDIFYNKGARIPEFINKYRGLLERLAKT